MIFLGETTFQSWPPKPVADWTSPVTQNPSLAHLNSSSTYKAFIRSLMEYCSPLWAGFPASYLSQLDAVETKAFKIIGITSTEVDSMGLSIFHRRQVSGLCFLPPPLGSCTLCALFHPQFSAGRTRFTIKSFLVNLPKSRIMAYLHSLIGSSFGPPVEQTYTFSSISIFPPDLQDSFSLPSQIIPNPKP